MKSTLKRFFITLVIGLLAASSASAQEFTGFFSIDTVSAYPGEPVGLPIYLNSNNVDFSTLALPLRYDADLLRYDSVSFASSILPNDFSGSLHAAPDSNLMSLFYLPPFEVPTPTINVTGGLIGTIWFTVDDQASPGFTMIDSASYVWTYFLNGEWKESWAGAIMADQIGTTTWFPDCTEGGIDILIPTAVGDEIDSPLPTEFALAQNYPNPFNPATTISFSLAEAGPVHLEIFNVLGQSVATLVDGIKPAGTHEVEFDASAYPTGLFFYRLTQGELSLTKKMVLVK